jgi:hypothetical protein
VKKDGVRCSAMVIGEGQNLRCGTHKKTLEKVGPNQIRRDELKYIHTKNTNDIYTQHRQILRDTAAVDYERTYRARETAIRLENLRYQTELNALELIVDQETDANGGQNADAAYIERQRQAQRLRRAAQEERRRQIHEQWNQQRQNIQQQARAIVPNVQHFADHRQLAQLANDRQNVHTAMVVAKVKETVDKILLIPVPLEYRTDTLKTSGEIILECKLSRAAAWQMMAKYCGDENIYEMGNGIYGRVLNSVWQYIKTSPDAADLKKILAAEMEDNIGMCAQGNLSRLCNILSGYLDGINTDVKSKNEIIGEKLAELMKSEPNEDNRREVGRLILRDHGIPFEEWNAWLEALE